ITYTHSLVIATFLPIAAVAPYAVAASRRGYFDDVFQCVGFVFYPAAAHLDSLGNRDGLRKLYLVSSRFILILSILGGAIAIFWSRDFFRLWLGQKIAEPANYPRVASLFAVLAVASIVTAGQRIGYQVLQGIQRIDVLAGLLTLEGVLNVLLSVILIRRYGLIGVAIGALIPTLIMEGFVQPFFVCRALAIPLRRYVMSVVARPALLTFVLAAVLFAARWLPRPETWP